MFSRKIRHVAIRSGSIRWISIRFDAHYYIAILHNFLLSHYINFILPPKIIIILPYQIIFILPPYYHIALSNHFHIAKSNLYHISPYHSAFIYIYHCPFFLIFQRISIRPPENYLLEKIFFGLNFIPEVVSGRKILFPQPILRKL